MKTSSPQRPGCFEHLEQRVLMAGGPYQFAAGGIRFDDGPRIFLAEGTVGTDDLLTGSVVYANFNSTSDSAPLDWTAITRRPDGGLSFTTRDGFEYASQDGGQFISHEGFPAGYLIGRDAQGETRDFAMVVEPYTLGNLTLRQWLKKDYLIVSYCALTSDGLQIIDAIVAPKYAETAFLGFDITYFFPSGAVTTQHNTETFADPTVTRLVSGEQIYTTISRSPERAINNFFMADTDPTDGIVGFGLAYARFQSPPATDVPQGVLRGAVLATGPESASFFGLSPSPVGLGPDGAVSIVFLFNAAGGFSLYRAAEYDSGLRVPINQGTWSLRDNFNDPDLDRYRLELHDGAGRTAVFRPSRAPASLLIAERVLATDGTTVEEIFGLAAGAGPSTTVRVLMEETVVHVDVFGHPVVYEYGISSESAYTGWYTGDLLAVVGGDPVVGPVYSWHDTDYRAFSLVGRSATGELQLWRRTTNQGGAGQGFQTWQYSNLTQSVFGARSLGGDIAGTTFAGSSSSFQDSPFGAVFSTDENGAYVAYVENTSGWQFVDVESLGFQGEGSRPDFVGPVAGYGTPWGGYNFAGLDSLGTIYAIWWTPTIGTQWSADNLSRAAGNVPRIVSNLTATTTTWGTFHISGLDESGHVLSVWWERGLGWHFDDLTARIGGPALVGAHLTSNFNPLQTVINIVGYDADGHTRVYWWSLDGFWQVSTPSAGLAPADRPLAPVASDAFTSSAFAGQGRVSGQSLHGTIAGGDVVRLVWWEHLPDQWRLENLTELARPL